MEREKGQCKEPCRRKRKSAVELYTPRSDFSEFFNIIKSGAKKSKKYKIIWVSAGLDPLKSSDMWIIRYAAK